MKAPFTKKKVLHCLLVPMSFTVAELWQLSKRALRKLHHEDLRLGVRPDEALPFCPSPRGEKKEEKRREENGKASFLAKLLRVSREPSLFA